MELKYRRENIMDTSWYTATNHFYKRYRNRMSKNVTNKTAKKKLLEADTEHLEKRANYMLLFSIHGRHGHTPNTEVRYYFNWNIIIDNRSKTLITMYTDNDRPMPPIRLFGDRKLRKTIYNLWFKPNSEIRKQINHYIEMVAS